MLGLQVLRSAQPLLPSQLPVLPQAPEAAAEQELEVRGAVPLAIFEQVPSLPDNLQL